MTELADELEGAMPLESPGIVEVKQEKVRSEEESKQMESRRGKRGPSLSVKQEMDWAASTIDVNDMKCEVVEEPVTGE